MTRLFVIAHDAFAVSGSKKNEIYNLSFRGSGGTIFMYTTCTSVSSGTMTVARGRGFCRFVVKSMPQQTHNSKKTGTAAQMTTDHVSKGTDVFVAFMLNDKDCDNVALTYM